MFLYKDITTSQADNEFDLLIRVKFFCLFQKLIFFSISPSTFDLFVIEVLIFFILLFMTLTDSYLVFHLLLGNIVETF